jgi:hypothetical protein
MLPQIRFHRGARRTPAVPRSHRRALLTAEALEGRQLPSTFTVTSAADSGSGTLRWAISQVDNSSSSSNTIKFSIPGSGTRTIALKSPLPAITKPVTIDGTSQAGYKNHPVIDLTASGRSWDAFDVDCPNVTIKGFAIGGFNAAVRIQSSNDVVEYCDLGTDYSGTYAYPNNYGVVISSGGSYNTVFDDVISGNRVAGVDIQDNWTDHNVVNACYIGTDATGRHPLGNDVGVLITGGASYNYVEDSVISANTIGVELSGMPTFHQDTTGNVVSYNWIGTDPSRRYNLGNIEGVLLYNVQGNYVTHNSIYYSSMGGVVETDYFHPVNTVSYNSFYHNVPGNIVPYPGYKPG